MPPITSPTADYLSFFSSLADLAPMSLLSLFFLGLFRVAPIIAVAPFLGAKLPSGVKMGLAVSIVVILLPHIVMTSKTAVNLNTAFLGFAIKELFLGFILAILVSVPFYIAEMSGVLIDFLRGSSALQVTDPFSQSQSSSIGMLYNYIMIVLFFQINGPIIFFDGVLGSYDIIPADGWINPSFFAFKQPFWQAIWSLATKIVAIAIQLSAPALLAILMTELFLGIANRLAPMVQIVFLGMSLKSLIGLALLCVGWMFIIQQMGKQTSLWLTEIQKIFLSFR